MESKIDYTAWGKLDRNSAALLTHPLIDHMLDVAACFTALTDCAAIRRAMTHAAGRELDESDISRLATITFLHDIGKANAGFQSRRWTAPHLAPKNWPTTPFGHGPEGWALMTGQAGAISGQVLGGLPLDDMNAWGAEAVYCLLRASISHHGRPVLNEPRTQVAHIWQPVCLETGEVLYDPARVVAAIGQHVLKGFPAAFAAGGRELPANAAFAHLFAGLVQLADWVGSDTRSGFFEYSTAGENRALTAPLRAQRAVRTIGLRVDTWRDALKHTPPDFCATFHVATPRPMQMAITVPDSQLVILEAETGSGKTEAALWRFVHLFQSDAVDGLFFAVPTRVAAAQLYERIRRFVKMLWPLAAPVVVRALPGNAAADGNTQNCLADFKVLWSDHPGDEVAHTRWIAEAPKRFLAATIAVGTIDQALLSALQVRHAHLRHALLSRSLLVVDEVHASDSYMTVVLEQLLKAHLATGGHALLLSATLGAVARVRYLNIGHSSAPFPVPTLPAASAMPYPAISHQRGPRVQLDCVEGKPTPKLLHWQTLDALDSPERIGALAMEAAVAGARVLVIRNTVPAAVATLRALEEAAQGDLAGLLFSVDGVRSVHHSRFSRGDREALDHAVEAALGKKRMNGVAGCIVIGTQTLEQSLDLDADLLITDLCPMDVLLQRVGRLHRHDRPAEERPTAFQAARAWVLTPPGHDLQPMLKRARHGLGRMHDGGGVYPDLRILEATRQLVVAGATRNIPAENRFLVEHATHPEALRALELSLGDAWQRLGEAIDGDRGARRGLAHTHAMQYDRSFAEISFPDSDQRIATRLGAADRLIAFDPPAPGPFGSPVAQIAVRFHQMPAGLSPDVGPTALAVMPGDTGFEFSLGPSRFRYSRFGLERLVVLTPASATTGEPA